MSTGWMHLIFIAFLLIFPWYGLIIYKNSKLTKNKFVRYVLIIIFCIVLELLDITWSTNYLNFIYYSLLLLFCGNYVTCTSVQVLRLRLKNRFLKWVIPVMMIVPVYLIAAVAFITGMAGFTFFNQHEIITVHSHGIFVHEIVETTYYDCGTHSHVYHIRRGISNIPLRRITVWKYEKIKCQICTDLLEQYYSKGAKCGHFDPAQCPAGSKFLKLYSVHTKEM